MGKTTSHQHLFLVTYGRAGSTLLQGMLNSFKGVRVFGENDQALMPIIESYLATKSSHRKMRNPKNDTPQNPYFGASRFMADSTKALYRDFIEALLFAGDVGGALLDSRIVGFKEIRHLFLPDGRLLRYLETLTELFPEAKFIFLTRNAAEVAASGWWTKNNPEKVKEQLTIFLTAVTEFSTTHPDACLHLKYEDLIGGPEEYLRIARFLDVEADTSKYSETLSRTHSYGTRTLTGLLRGLRKDVVLLEEQWWRDEILDFDINVNRTGDGVEVDGFILPRTPGVAALSVGQEGCVGSGVALVSSGGTPELAERFKYVAGADKAGFRALLPVDPGSSPQRIELRRGGAIVARIALQDM